MKDGFLRTRLHGGRLFAVTTGEGWGWISGMREDNGWGIGMGPRIREDSGWGMGPRMREDTGGGWVGTGGSRTAPTGTGR